MMGRPSDKQLRSFAIVMAVAFGAAGLLIFFRGKPEFMLAWTAALLFIAAGMIRPQWLAWPYVIWMKIASVLAWINTRILLCVIFYAIMAPVGLAMRLFGFDPLERRYDKRAKTYWAAHKKRTFVRSDYERLY